jgi:SAM-dependent methyltransferase
MQEVQGNKIEILSADFLRENRHLVHEFRQVARSLRLGLGWHYLLDLIWAAKEVGPVFGHQIMDAGAGVGVMQWWMASKGANVVSADRLNRSHLGRRFRAWCPVRGLRAGVDLNPLSKPGLRAFLPPRRIQHWPLWPLKIGNTFFEMFSREPLPPKDRGTVTVYNQDLRSMPDVMTDSIDAIVSISSLEHNSPEDLRAIVHELMRVLKPGGKLVATLGGSKEKDWFHEPSKGWCYTEATLRDLFKLDSASISNYEQYDELFGLLRDCAELRDNLARFYFRSGNNGMPWGVWDPKYQPVGVVKVKPI